MRMSRWTLHSLSRVALVMVSSIALLISCKKKACFTLNVCSQSSFQICLNSDSNAPHSGAAGMGCDFFIVLRQQAYANGTQRRFALSGRPCSVPFVSKVISLDISNCANGIFLSHAHHVTLPAFSSRVKASTLRFSASSGSPRAHIPNIANNVFLTTTQSTNNVNATKSVRFEQRPYSVFKDVETVRDYKSGRLFTSCVAAAGGHESDTQEELAHGLETDLDEDEDSVVRSFEVMSRWRQRLSRVVEECGGSRMFPAASAAAIEDYFEYFTAII